MPGNRTFSAGAFTLSGWNTDFTSGANDFVLGHGIAASVFEWTANTRNLPLAPPGADSPQNILIQDSSGGTDLVSLTLTFQQTTANLFLLNASNVDILDASSGGTLTLGGITGESASQLISDLRGIQVEDDNSHDSFDINFTLTDVTTNTPQSFSEFFFTSCFAPGTRIATPAGETAVEELQIGDLVSTTSGVAKPVKWIGRRSYSADTVAEFSNLRPVLIHKNALAPGLPQRDLMVSPMHALFIDEVFIPAASLVNGVSILRRDTAGAADYIHIELDAHDVIFAEGAPAETFVDDNSRALFENASEYYDLYGMIESARSFSAPRLEEGYQLEAVRSRIAARAGIGAAGGVPGSLSGHVERLGDGMLEGWVMDPANPAVPVELEVLVDGEIVATLLANRYRVDLDRADLAGGSCAFTVAMPAAAASIGQIEVRRAADGSRIPLPRPARAFALTELSTSR